jgi:hypothetical protein
MNAKYYEYVNEKRKNFKKSGWSRTYNLDFANQLLYHLQYHMPLLSLKKFYIKGKPCLETHNFKMLGVLMGTLDLWISRLPLYHLSHANHVHVKKLLNI